MRQLGLLAAGLAVVLVSGCADPSEAPPGANAPVTTPTFAPASCPANPDPIGVKRGAIPDGFSTAWVLRCRETQQAFQDEGTWSVLLEERAEGPAVELVAGLRGPSDVIPADIACTMELRVVPYFVLVDASGRAVLAAVPTDKCSKPKESVLSALAALPFKTVKTTRIAQLETPAATAAGCAMDWKAMLAITAADGSAKPGPAAEFWQTATLKVCVYGPGSEDSVGRFISGRTSDDASTAGILDKLQAAPAAVACDKPNSRFAVLHPAQGQEAYVELDGCLRVLRPDGTLGQLTPATVALLV